MAEEKAEPKKKIDRKFHDKQTGRLFDIVRVFYDPRSNCVIDEYEVTRTFKDSDKKTVKITTLRRSYSQDNALQKKHRVDRITGQVKEL